MGFLAAHMPASLQERIAFIRSLNLETAGGVALYGMGFAMLILPMLILGFESFSRSWSQKQEIPPPIPPPTRIAELRIYPIKSCRGIKLEKAQLLKTGLELDRMWMWVDASNNKFMTIRDESKMTLIKTSLDQESGQLIVDATSINPKAALRIPARPSQAWLDKNTTLETVHIWGKDTDGYVYAQNLTSAFQQVFGVPVRLVRKGPKPRPLASNGAPKYLGRAEKVNFPDLAPVLCASLSSIAELNARLKEKGEEAITVERFRPNIIVHGGEPWSEDQWKTVTIGATSQGQGEDPEDGITMDVTQRCARCQVPNVDPDTGAKHKKEPYGELMGYRRVDWGMKWKPCVGMLCAPRDEGEIAVGQELRITRTTALHKYIIGFS